MATDTALPAWNWELGVLLLTEDSPHAKIRAPASVEPGRPGHHHRADQGVHDDTEPWIHAPRSLAPVVECICLIEPPAGEHRTAHEVG